MNKTININLGGFPFTMDELAFDLLERYISSIKNHFAYSDSYQEIITDIEIRLGELLHEKTEAKSIVTTADVEYAIKTMGRPEEFGAESIDLPGEDFENAAKNKSNYRRSATGRKLFRNIAEKKLGGVCAGIAAYFGIRNVMWVRLAFIVFTITGGFAIPLYIIMWIFIPEAKTSADYLAMKGEKITVSNIADYLEKEINNFSTHVSEFTDDIQERLGGNRKKSIRSGGSSIDLEQNIKASLRSLARFFRPLMVVIGTLLLLFFAGIWITAVVGLVMSIPVLNYVTSSSALINFIGGINSIVVLGVPLAFVVFSALKLLFRTKINRGLKQSLLVFWLSNLICLVILGATTFKEYRNNGALETKQELGILKSDVIELKVNEADYENAHLQFGDLRLGDDDRLEISHEFRMNIFPSDTNTWYITKKVKARGSDSKEAKFNANCVEYNVLTLNDHQLEIPTYYSINKDCKFRFQQVELDLHIPIGKSIILPKELEWRLNEVSYNKDQMKDGWKFIAGKRYTMTGDGLICADCTTDELKTITEPEDYEHYVSSEEIPNDALLQGADAKNDINYNRSGEVLISFDKIIGGGPDKIKFDRINFNVEQSPDSMIHIYKKLKFYGPNGINNDNFDQYYAFKQTGNEIIFSNVAFLNQDLNAVNPSIEVTLSLPVGAKVRFDESVNEFDEQIKFDTDEIPNNWRFVKKELLLMSPKGLKCINCN